MSRAARMVSNKNLAAAVLLALAQFCLFHAANAGTVERKYSRFGDIAVAADFERGSTISLNGAVIFRSPELEYLSFVELVSAENRDYIIVSENAGGSGTPDVFSIVAIGSGGFYRIYPGVALRAENGRVVSSVTGSAVRFALEDEGVYTREAVIENDTLRIVRKELDRPKSLNGQDCQYLFTQVLSECADQRGSTCGNTLDSLSMASQRGLSSALRNVFFPAKAFAAMCDAACSRGHVWLDYSQFADSICNFR